MRYSPTLSPVASESSFDLTPRSWLLKDNPNDTAVLNKMCALSRANILSNYWKVPESQMNLSCMAINRPHDRATNHALAIASASSDANLFVYDLNVDDNYLTHHTTITLPNIQCMQYLSDGKHLMTGNDNGYAHLVSIPTFDDPDSPAEICKRFNHKRALRRARNSASGVSTETHAPVGALQFLDETEEKALTQWGQNLFLWDVGKTDSQTKPSASSVSQIPGLLGFDAEQGNASQVGICGRFGVSLVDFRDAHPTYNVPSVPLSAQMSGPALRRLKATRMRWNPDNNNVFAAAHGDDVVRLWDIRKLDCFAELHGHTTPLTSLEWNGSNLFTGGRDGKIMHWDLNEVSLEKGPVQCSLKEGMDSVSFNHNGQLLKDNLSMQQCGTILPASNTNIVDLKAVRNLEGVAKVLSVDGSNFLGMHARMDDSFSVNLSGDYYSQSEVDLMLAAYKSLSSLALTSGESSNVTEPLNLPKSERVAVNYQDDSFQCNEAKFGLGQRSRAWSNEYTYAPSNLPNNSTFSVDSHMNSSGQSSDAHSILTVSTAPTQSEMFDVKGI